MCSIRMKKEPRARPNPTAMRTMENVMNPEPTSEAMDGDRSLMMSTSEGGIASTPSRFTGSLRSWDLVMRPTARNRTPEKKKVIPG